MNVVTKTHKFMNMTAYTIKINKKLCDVHSNRNHEKRNHGLWVTNKSNYYTFCRYNTICGVLPFKCGIEQHRIIRMNSKVTNSHYKNHLT